MYLRVHVVISVLRVGLCAISRDFGGLRHFIYPAGFFAVFESLATCSSLCFSRRTPRSLLFGLLCTSPSHMLLFSTLLAPLSLARSYPHIGSWLLAVRPTTHVASSYTLRRHCMCFSFSAAPSCLHILHILAVSACSQLEDGRGIEVDSYLLRGNEGVGG